MRKSCNRIVVVGSTLRLYCYISSQGDCLSFSLSPIPLRMHVEGKIEGESSMYGDSKLVPSYARNEAVSGYFDIVPANIYRNKITSPPPVRATKCGEVSPLRHRETLQREPTCPDNNSPQVSLKSFLIRRQNCILKRKCAPSNPQLIHL